MKLTSFFVALFLLFLLCGVPFAKAQPRFGDPVEQAKARAEVKHALLVRKYGYAPVTVAPDLPAQARAMMAQNVEDTMLTMLAMLNRAVVLVSTEEHDYADKTGIVFCGSAYLDHTFTRKHLFALSTRKGEDIRLDLSEADWVHAGCEGAGTLLR